MKVDRGKSLAAIVLVIAILMAGRWLSLSRRADKMEGVSHNHERNLRMAKDILNRETLPDGWYTRIYREVLHFGEELQLADQPPIPEGDQDFAKKGFVYFGFNNGFTGAREVPVFFFETCEDDFREIFVDEVGELDIENTQVNWISKIAQGDIQEHGVFEIDEQGQYIYLIQQGALEGELISLPKGTTMGMTANPCPFSRRMHFSLLFYLPKEGVAQPMTKEDLIQFHQQFTYCD